MPVRRKARVTRATGRAKPIDRTSCFACGRAGHTAKDCYFNERARAMLHPTTRARIWRDSGPQSSEPQQVGMIDQTRKRVGTSAMLAPPVEMQVNLRDSPHNEQMLRSDGRHPQGAYAPRTDDKHIEPGIFPIASLPQPCEPARTRWSATTSTWHLHPLKGQRRLPQTSETKSSSSVSIRLRSCCHTLRTATSRLYGWDWHGHKRSSGINCSDQSQGASIHSPIDSLMAIRARPQSAHTTRSSSQHIGTSVDRKFMDRKWQQTHEHMIATQSRMFSKPCIERERWNTALLNALVCDPWKRTPGTRRKPSKSWHSDVGHSSNTKPGDHVREGDTICLVQGENAVYSRINTGRLPAEGGEREQESQF